MQPRLVVSSIGVTRQSGYVAFTLTSINVSHGPHSGSTTILVTGTNFSATATYTARCAGVDCTNVAYVNSTTLTIKTATGMAVDTDDSSDVYVSDGTTSRTLSKVFVVEPVLTSISPSTATVDSPTVFTLHGSGFTGLTDSNTNVAVGSSTDGDTFAVTNDTTATCTISPDSGNADQDVDVVFAEQPDGLWTLTLDTAVHINP